MTRQEPKPLRNVISDNSEWFKQADAHAREYVDRFDRDYFEATKVLDELE